MTDGITFDKASYNKGDIITVTVTDAGRAPVPAGQPLTESVTFSTALASGQIVNGLVDVVTPGTPAVPETPPGAVTATGGRTVTLVTGSDTGTTAKYTTGA